jgi:hypothetical protein
MRSPNRRPFLVLTISVLALVATGCGVKAGDQSASTPTTTSAPSRPSTGSTTTEASSNSTSTTVSSSDRTPQQQAALDTVIQTYENLGLNKKDATCLGESLVGSGDTSVDPTDTGSIMDAINKCDISADKLSKLGGGAAGNVDDGVRLGLKASLKSAGLDEAQASCVADAFVSKYAAQDPAKLRSLLQSCNVDPSDLHLGN